MIIRPAKLAAIAASGMSFGVMRAAEAIIAPIMLELHDRQAGVEQEQTTSAHSQSFATAARATVEIDIADTNGLEHQRKVLELAMSLR